MFQIKIDTLQNRLMVVLSGTVDAKEAEQYFNELEQRVPTELTAGFEIMTDLSRLQHLTHEATLFIRKSMDLFNQQGVSHIIRMVSHPTRNFAFNLMSYFHYDHQVRIETYESSEGLPGKRRWPFTDQQPARR